MKKRDVLSASNDDDQNADIESCSDIEPETTRKIKTTGCHLSTDSESGSAEKQDSDDKSEIYAAGAGNYNMAGTNPYSKLKKLWGKFRGETNTYRLY
jgi:hypothetical protein